MKKYLVGGFVRDKLLEISSKDKDYLIVAESYKQMKKELLEVDKISIFQERPEFNIIRGRYKNEAVDFIFCDNFEEDIKRRDFTINALAIDVTNEDEEPKIIDIINGMKDLENGIIRKVSENSISDDPIRIIRALRFMLKYNFTLSKPLIEDIKKYRNDLFKINADRIRNELQAFLDVDTSLALNLLYEYDLLSIFSQKNIFLKTGVKHN